MKTWTTPGVNELDVCMTASSGNPGVTEAAGFLQNGWNDPTFDSAIYEDAGDCVIPKKARTRS